jgi:segregation and condensation protein A
VENVPPETSLPVDGLLPPTEHPIRLDVFEGPLDLLLFLIRKNEVDIYDIPIETVTRQYLAVLRNQEKGNLDLAGDFFVMAATLMYIKSRMLLPAAERKDEEAVADDGTHDPRWSLVQQLIQYKRVKETAGILRGLIDERQGLLAREVSAPNPEDLPPRPVAPTDRIELWNTFNLILRRLAERIQPGDIGAESVTVTDRMEHILSRLGEETSFTFSSLLPERPTLPFLVSTFLACLELARLGTLTLEQDAQFGEILCQRASQAIDAPAGGSEFDEPAPEAGE